jgi:hypothetical protein
MSKAMSGRRNMPSGENRCMFGPVRKSLTLDLLNWGKRTWISKVL